jgi:DNA topoisomerase-1
MNIVIVESPSKAKTIEKYLGKDYKVIASKGHVVDLPKSSIAIDIEHEFTPEYEVKNPAVLRTIKNELKNADSLLLAVDPDREGEAIGWHIARELKLIDKNGKDNNRSKLKLPVKRIVFTEITKDAVLGALSSPRTIDINLVNAQQTRRVLDRLVGYKLSPLLWKKLMFGLSAGRVQSVALRLIVERERERDAFKSEEYWNIYAFLTESKPNEPLRILINKAGEEDLTKIQESKAIRFQLTKIKGEKKKVNNEEAVKSIIDQVKSSSWLVKDIVKKVGTRSPSPPFNTSTLQQAAANIIGFSASRTMKIAQQLYEQGHITYMRTDSFNLSEQARSSIAKYIKAEFGLDYIPEKPRLYKTKSKVAQEAHEAIRPVNIEKSSAVLKLSTDQKKLYDLIYRRVLASQMSDARVEQNKICVQIDDYEFEAEGVKILFPGFLAAKSDKVKEAVVPQYQKGQELFLEKIEGHQKFTEPPARYTEASLIKALEAYGIGRPSTYAPILTTILSRKYIEKDGKQLVPTLVGKSLIRLLIDHFPNIVDVGFTAKLEDDLDDIANGKKQWVSTLQDFYSPFEKGLLKAEKTIEKDKYNIVGESKEKCPECGSKMVVKLGRFSPFLSCSKFPKCKGILPLANKDEEKIDVGSPDFISKYQEGPKTEDGRGYNLKKSRFGYFWAHPDYPKVKDAKPLELTRAMQLELFGENPKEKGIKFELKKSKFGYFWAHPDYPKVKSIIKINTKLIRSKAKDLGLIGV